MNQMERTGIGIIGCGSISGIYLTNLMTRFVHTRVVACADLNRERSQAAADKYGVARAETVEELLRDPEVEIVVNLTPPRAHMEVSRVQSWTLSGNRFSTSNSLRNRFLTLAPEVVG
jgi:predicted dehydrogenase